MAASTVQPPSPDDVTGIAGMLTWLRDWGWGVLGSVVLPGAWHISGRITKIEERILQHESKLSEQVATNREIRDRVDRLADKDDVVDLRQDIREIRRSVEVALGMNKPLRAD